MGFFEESINATGFVDGIDYAWKKMEAITKSFKYPHLFTNMESSW